MLSACPWGQAMQGQGDDYSHGGLWWAVGPGWPCGALGVAGGRQEAPRPAAVWAEGGAGSPWDKSTGLHRRQARVTETQPGRQVGDGLEDMTHKPDS